jgi:hypothetical protein
VPIWMQVLGCLVLFVTFVGSAVVFLRGSADKGTIETLERNNRALNERVALLESENTRHTANEVRLTARVEALERENASLEAARPSAEAIDGIDTKLTAFIGRADGRGTKALALLMAIASTVGDRDDPTD